MAEEKDEAPPIYSLTIHSKDEVDDLVDSGAKTFKCRNKTCGKPIGITNGFQLYMGAAVFTGHTHYACVYCGYFGKWMPVMKKKRVPK